jgi:hypothetical protein
VSKDIGAIGGCFDMRSRRAFDYGLAIAVSGRRSSEKVPDVLIAGIRENT